MAEFLFSSHWYRVANLHPRLRSHAVVTRQFYRDQLWFLLQDKTSARHHRVNQNAYQFVGRMDGNRTVQEIWDVLVEDLGDDAPTQDEAIQILCQLSDADLLQCEVTPDVTELFRRRDERSSKRRQSMINPLAFRVPLLDPSRMLDRLVPFVRILFHPAMLLVWLGIVSFAAVIAFSNWPALRAQASVHMLTPRYLLLLWLSYPVIKAIHELGHNSATRIIPSAASIDAAPSEVTGRAGSERYSELSEAVQEIHNAIAGSVARYRDFLGSCIGQRSLL